MKNVKNELSGLGEKILKDIDKKENPNIDIPIRALSNVIFDKKTGQLGLGDKTSKRYFFNA
ncbi:MAG: DNA topoisomerase IV subunit A, partial [Candidatus Aenigmarchaeota archaeon]|nr:DNA topoisomerase IV subunit A [Candidatus Aenigmarchaeota archaeon]